MKKGLAFLLALVIMLSVASPALSPVAGIIAKAADTDYVELAFDNLFIFEQWSNSTWSGRLPGGYDNAGTLTKNMTSGSFTLTRKDDGVHPDCYTGFSFDTCSEYYVIPVEGNTTYNFSYDIQSSGGYGSYVFCYNKEKVSLGTEYNVHFFNSASNNWNFTTPADAAYIQVRFDSNTVGVASTFSNIRICKADTHKGTSTVRKAYTKGSGNYGTLPVPTREGYTFGGWFTGENGTGEQITENTPIRSESISVFARWDIAVSSISIKDMPTKVEYSVGEHINTTGLVLNAVAGSTTHEIASGFTCTPEYLNTVGTQTITVSYAGKTATFDVVVKESLRKNILLNGSAVSATVANGKYTFAYYQAFNYYKLTYKTSSYMKGVLTFNDGTSEDFYLEPSNNGTFSSYITDYFTVESNRLTRTGIKSIEFTYLDKNMGDFELLSVTAENRTRVYKEQRFSNDHFTVGINYEWGGTLSYLEDIKNNPTATANASGTQITLSDAPAGLNLINTYDKGRYVQAAYYGTDGTNDDYETGTYNGDPNWPYNPVQGGNQKNGDQAGYNAASKVVDYEAVYVDNMISEIYVKTQPLDWAKSKDDITPSYMETRYVFEHGMVKVYCRFIDFSGYNHNEEKRQEIPAFYPIEPLNELVYYSGGEAWSSSNQLKHSGENAYNFDNIERGPYDILDANERWAAYIDGTYGIGIYSSRADGFSAGVFRPKNNTKSTDANPSDDDPSSYITPFATYKMESYKVEESAYYITTGTPAQIRSDFEKVANPKYAEKLSQAVIAVPETVYMTPSTGKSMTGQHYVNNVVDAEGNLSVNATASTNTSISIYAPGATKMSFDTYLLDSSYGKADFQYEGEYKFSDVYAGYGNGCQTSDYFYFDATNGADVNHGFAVNFSSGGLSAGQSAVMEWKVTLYYGDADTIGKTYYAYTTLYAPHRSVGAVSEARTSGTYNNEISSWITGVNGVSSSYSPVAPVGSGIGGDKHADGYFVYDPLYTDLYTGGSSESTDDYVTTSSTDKYVNAKATNGADGSRAVGFLGLLTVDTSRYTNTNQIPNFKIGWDALRVNSGKKDSMSDFYAWYTLGTASTIITTDNSSYGTKPSGWTEYKHYSEPQKTSRDSFVPQYALSDVSGKYIHVAAQGSAYYWTAGTHYSNAAVSVLFTTVNKAELRELVIKASSLEESNYTTESWSAFKTALQTAAGELGNPSDGEVATATTELKNKMNALQTPITLNANGGETTKTVNVTVGTASAATFTPDTPVKNGYELVSWNSRETGTGTDYGKGQITVPFKATIYAQWAPAEYKLTYNPDGGNMGSTSKFYTVESAFALETATKEGHTFKGWKVTTADGNWDASKTYAAGEAINGLYGNVTLTAQWEQASFTINFDGNGADDIAFTQAQLVAGSSVTLPTASKALFALAGWAYSADATAPDFAPNATITLDNIDSSKFVNNTLTLYAVWAEVGPQNVTFDNLVDISAWSDSVGNGTIDNDTDIGFTVKSDIGAGEATCSSAYFPVTPGHKYVVEADVKGDNWDIYFFFCDANGNWVNFSDSGNRLASYGHNQTTDGIHVTSTEFTAPAGAVKAQLRVDANGSNNAVRFENIRVNDTANRTYLETVNKVVEYGEAYGELPVPVKPGQTFLGWKDTNGNTVTAADLMKSTSTVYLTSAWTTDANSISNDTVVVEYGMPVRINVRANDKSGDAVNAIGVASIADNTLGHTSHPNSKFAGNSITLTNGKAVLNADGTITYTLDKTNVVTEEVFYYEVQINGSYYYAKVTVIPATTLYFEDTLFKFENATVTKNGVDYNYAWEVVGSPAGDEAQATDRPGPFNFEDDANNVYGYDSAKDGEAAFSGGSAHYTEVDKIAGAGGPTATFTFTGTGFDLFTVTDSKAGMFTATIYEGDKVDSTKRVKGVISNAYFGYDFDTELNDFVVANKGAIYQVPVLRERNLGYGTYTVVIQPRYNKSYDVANTGWSGVYVDSVRIFNPMGTDNTTANNAYKADGEYAPQYLEIRDTLITPKLENGIYTGEYDFSVLENNKSVFLDGSKTSLADFAKLGPKNEVYLQAGDAVAFDIVTNSPVLPSTVQLGMGLTGNGGNTATVTLMNANYNGWKEDITLNSTAERYYNIESVVDWVLQSDGTYKTASPVIITNTSGGIISLTSLKWAFNQDIATTKLALIADEDTPVMARAAISRMLNPEPDNTVIAKENVAYSFSSESYAIGENGTLTISTEHGVAGVTVNGAEVVSCEAVENGKLNWTFEFTADVAGEVTYEIVVRDEAGNESEAIYAVTTVTDDSAATEPDDGIVDDGEDDDTTNNVGSGNLTSDSFVKNLLNGIMGILMKLFSLFLGGATV